MEVDIGSQFAGHSRRHLHECRIALHGKQVFCAHAAVVAETAEVVAQQVDDHHVLAAVLGVAAEPLRNISIFARRSAARGGSLHGASGDAARDCIVFQAEEQFRRKGLDAAVLLGMEESAVGDRLAAAQALVKCGRAACGMHPYGHSKVELIDVARANPLMNGSDAFSVLLFRDRQRGFELRSGFLLQANHCRTEFLKAGRIAVGECPSMVVEEITPVVDAEPG